MGEHDGFGVLIGIDLASKPKRTAACLIRWAEPIIVGTPTLDLDDSALIGLMRRADRIGMDIPFGWPMEFARQVSIHSAGGAWTIPHTDARLTLCATDRFVERTNGRRSLSVSTDKIGVPAMRAAHLLASRWATGPERRRAYRGGQSGRFNARVGIPYNVYPPLSGAVTGSVCAAAVG